MKLLSGRPSPAQPTRGGDHAEERDEEAGPDAQRERRARAHQGREEGEEGANQSSGLYIASKSVLIQSY